MKKILFASLVFLICQIPSICKASEPILSQKLVTESALKNYPKILSAYEQVNYAEGSVLASKGFFDIKLKQNYLDKSRGF